MYDVEAHGHMVCNIWLSAQQLRFLAWVFSSEVFTECRQLVWILALNLIGSYTCIVHICQLKRGDKAEFEDGVLMNALSHHR